MRSDRRDPQRGSTMLVVMAILLALLAGGAVALYMQLADTRAASMVRSSRDALACAEAGLAKARGVVGSNYQDWDEALDNDEDNDPAWYPISGDLDTDPDDESYGVSDYTVTIMDNADEAPNTNEPTRDNDLRVYIISECIKFPETPRKVMELVLYEGGGNMYKNQSGQGSGNTGNTN